MATHKKQPKSPIKGVRFKRDILGAIAEYGEYEGIEGFPGQLRSLVVKALRLANLSRAVGLKHGALVSLLLDTVSRISPADFFAEVARIRKGGEWSRFVKTPITNPALRLSCKRDARGHGGGMENKNTPAKQSRFRFVIRFAEGGIACGRINSTSAEAGEAKLQARYAARNVISIEVRK